MATTTQALLTLPPYVPPHFTSDSDDDMWAKLKYKYTKNNNDKKAKICQLIKCAVFVSEVHLNQRLFI